MVEEVLDVFDVMDIDGRDWALFFTSARIVVVSMDRVSWTIALVMAGIIVSDAIIVLLLKSGIVFVVGLGFAVGVGVSFSLIRKLVRRISVGRLRRLAADDILRRAGKSYDIPYKSIAEIRERQIRMPVGGSHVWYLVRLPPEVRYKNVIDFVTTHKTYSFFLSHKVLRRCVDLIHKIRHDKITQD